MSQQVFKKYLKVYIARAKTRLMVDMQYRFDFINALIGAVIKVSAVFILIKLMYGNTNSIVGWKKEDVFLLFGMQGLYFTIYKGLLGNIGEIAHAIKDGYLDLALLKPFKILFVYISDNYILFSIPEIITSIFMIYYAYHLGATLPLLEATLCIFLSIIFYFSIDLFFQTLNFYTIFANNATNLVEGIFNFTKVPPSFYNKTIQTIFSFIFPIFVTGGIAFLINMEGYSKFLYFNILIIVISFYYFSIKFWMFSLTKYSGASS